MARRLLAATAVLLLGGCNWYYHTLPSPDDLMAAVPWFDHMIKSRAVHPYQRADIPRSAVAGTVPVTGGEADWRAEFAAANPATADRLANPTVPAETLARGDTLYQIYCAVRHGSGGAADGPVGPRVGAPSLLAERARGLSDGYLYSIIRYGRGVMPRYGDKVTRPDERLAMVNYIRRLQRGDPPPATVPGGGR